MIITMIINVCIVPIIILILYGNGGSLGWRDARGWGKRKWRSECPLLPHWIRQYSRLISKFNIKDYYWINPKNLNVDFRSYIATNSVRFKKQYQIRSHYKSPFPCTARYVFLHCSGYKSVSPQRNRSNSKSR